MTTLMNTFNQILQAFLLHPYTTIIIIFMVVKYKYVIEALSSYDKERKVMVVSSRKVIAFMSANSLFHQVHYCMTHTGMKDFNVYVGWTECTMTLVLLGLVTLPEAGAFIQSVKNIIPGTVTKETKEAAITKETTTVVN